jgi:hypothetical protein
VYSIIYFVKYIAEQYVQTLTENPLETRVENTAYNITQSVEYSVKYTRQIDVTQHVNQLDNSWIPRDPQPKGQGPWPLASRTWAGSQSSVCEEASDGAYTQRPQSKGHSYGLWPQWHGKPWQWEPGKYVVASPGFALWFFLSGDKEEVRGERARAHLVQEREIDLQVCVFFRLLILIAI